jgi:hypothetical protein
MKSLIHGSWTSGAFNAAKLKKNKQKKNIFIFRYAPRSGGALPTQLI